MDLLCRDPLSGHSEAGAKLFCKEINTLDKTDCSVSLFSCFGLFFVQFLLMQVKVKGKTVQCYVYFFAQLFL